MAAVKIMMDKYDRLLYFAALQGIFLAVTISSLAAAGLLCFVLLSYARYKRLLMIPSGPEIS